MKFEELKGKEIVLVNGILGVGKSTICQSFVGGPDSLEMDEDGSLVVKEGRELYHNGERIFEIVDDCVGGKDTPTFCKIVDTAQRTRYLIDSAGIVRSECKDFVTDALTT